MDDVRHKIAPHPRNYKGKYEACLSVGEAGGVSLQAETRHGLLAQVYAWVECQERCRPSYVSPEDIIANWRTAWAIEEDCALEVDGVRCFFWWNDPPDPDWFPTSNQFHFHLHFH